MSRGGTGGREMVSISAYPEVYSINNLCLFEAGIVPVIEVLEMSDNIESSFTLGSLCPNIMNFEYSGRTWCTA